MTDERPNEVPQEPVAEATVPQPSPREPMPGFFSTLPGVLFSPSSAFGRLGGARWYHALAPMLILGLLAGLASFTFIKRVDMEQFVRDQLRHNRFASKMTSEQMDQAVEKAKDANPYTRSAVTVPITVAWLFLVGLIYWAAFLAMGSGLTFPQGLQVVAWAQVPYWIASLLGCGVFLMKDPNDVDPQNAVLSNIGAFLGREEMSGWLYALLSSVDLFAIWVLVLYILGFSALAKVSKGKAAAVVLVIFVVKTALKVAFAAVFSV